MSKRKAVTGFVAFMFANLPMSRVRSKKATPNTLGQKQEFTLQALSFNLLDPGAVVVFLGFFDPTRSSHGVSSMNST